MQEITVQNVSPGQTDKSPTVITDSSGAKMSGFDSGLKALAAGDVLKVELEVKGKYTNIKSYELVRKGAGAAPERTPVAAVRDEAISRAEIDARFRVAALQAASAMGVAGRLVDCHAVLSQAELNYAWLTTGAKPPALQQPILPRKDTPPPTPLPVPPETKTAATAAAKPGMAIGLPVAMPSAQEMTQSQELDREFEDLRGAYRAPVNSTDTGMLMAMVFKDIGEFRTACLKYLGIQPSQADQELKGKYDLKMPSQRQEAWQRLVGLPREHKAEGGK